MRSLKWSQTLSEGITHHGIQSRTSYGSYLYFEDMPYTVGTIPVQAIHLFRLLNRKIRTSVLGRTWEIAGWASASVYYFNENGSNSEVEEALFPELMQDGYTADGKFLRLSGIRLVERLSLCALDGLDEVEIHRLSPDLQSADFRMYCEDGYPVVTGTQDPTEYECIKELYQFALPVDSYKYFT